MGNDLDERGGSRAPDRRGPRRREQRPIRHRGSVTVDGSPVRNATVSGKVTVNELTTVAAGFSLAQFAGGGSLGGTAPGISNAAKMPRNLVDPRTGARTRFLLSAPNGSSTETLATFDSLASIISGCVADAGRCARFLDAATDAWGTRPATTWQAMTLLPTNPSGAPEKIFAQVPRHPRFTPVRTTPPAGWYLALKFWGNGHQFNGPGNLAFDSAGRVWTNTNATWPSGASARGRASSASTPTPQGVRWSPSPAAG